jgi:hypothetical protein
MNIQRLRTPTQKYAICTQAEAPITWKTQIHRNNEHSGAQQHPIFGHTKRFSTQRHRNTQYADMETKLKRDKST